MSGRFHFFASSFRGPQSRRQMLAGHRTCPPRRTAQVAAVLWVALSVSAVGAASLTFRNDVSLPALALRLPLMSEAQALPLPPVQTFLYTFTRGTETWQEERFDPLALWYESQHAARWQDGNGNGLTLGVATALLPAAFTDKHVTREQYAKVVASAASELSRPTPELLHRWMLDFAGVPVGAPEALKINSSHLAGLLRFSARDPRVNAYAFRLDPQRAGQAHATNAWFGVVIVTAGTDPAADREAIERQLLTGLATTGRFEGRTTATDRAASRAAAAVRQHPTRDAARRSVAQLTDWWSLDSDDFIVLSNSPTAARFAQDLLEDLQAARSLFARWVPGFASSAEDVAVVRMFATSGEYEAYVGPDQVWTAGLFDPQRRELVLRPPAARGRDSQYQRALRVALHEAFHQYLFQATGGAPVSPWFNEGHAAFLETAETSNRRVTIVESDEYIEILQRLVASKDLNIAPLLAMDYATFYSGSNEERAARYSLAWGLIYYLEREAPLERNRPHVDILPRYMQALKLTGKADAATVYAFEGISLPAFQSAFTDFWRSSTRRNAARRSPLP